MSAELVTIVAAAAGTISAVAGLARETLMAKRREKILHHARAFAVFLVDVLALALIILVFVFVEYVQKHFLESQSVQPVTRRLVSTALTVLEIGMVVSVVVPALLRTMTEVVQLIAGWRKPFSEDDNHSSLTGGGER